MKMAFISITIITVAFVFGYVVGLDHGIVETKNIYEIQIPILQKLAFTDAREIYTPGYIKIIDDFKENRINVDSEKDFEEFTSISPCLNYSYQLKQALQDDYRVEAECGYLEKNSSRRHTWLMISIPIEATSGRIISKSEYDQRYSERDACSQYFTSLFGYETSINGNAYYNPVEVVD